MQLPLRIRWNIIDLVLAILQIVEEVMALVASRRARTQAKLRPLTQVHMLHLCLMLSDREPGSGIPQGLKVPRMFCLDCKMVSCKAPTAIRVQQVDMFEFDSALRICLRCAVAEASITEEPYQNLRLDLMRHLACMLKVRVRDFESAFCVWCSQVSQIVVHRSLV